MGYSDIAARGIPRKSDTLSDCRYFITIREIQKEYFKMTARKSISKKVRFEVFKRDLFKCQYCGSEPPSVRLELDHIQPASKGGENDLDNLITACFDCNRGKSNNLLSSIPASLKEKAEQELELEDQLKAIKKIKAAKKRRVNRDIRAVESVFSAAFESSLFSESFKVSMRTQFLPKLGVDDLIENMEIAVSRINDPEKAVKYFCGINWNAIRERSSYEY